MRLDIFLVDVFDLRSRKVSQDLIRAGMVVVNGTVCTKPSRDVDASDDIVITKRPSYVSRGGLKLEKALTVFAASPEGKICVDIGASTGGFTDCLLKNGAAKVYAVDVGHGQLDPSLASDARVENIEGTNVNDFAANSGIKSSFITADVSFVSLRNVLPSIKTICSEKADIICLFKPQFEVGRFQGKRIGDKKTHISLLKSFITFLTVSGLTVKGLDYSPIRGGDGNIEYLFWLVNYASDTGNCYDIRQVVEKARTECTEVNVV